MALTEYNDLGLRIGKAIAKQRIASRLTQAEVAERLNVSNDAISRMERGTIMPTVKRLVQFAEVFDCETADFLQESSPIVSEQAQRIIKLLSMLEETERVELLDIIEKMVMWHLQPKKK